MCRRQDRLHGQVVAGGRPGVPERSLHIHSMVVHAVIALAAVAALAFVLDAAGAAVASIRAGTWAFLWRAALVGIVATGLPATLSGITERNHMYANWHASHRAKLVLSLVLLAVVVAEVAALAGTPGPPRLGSPAGLGVVMINPLVCLALSYYGLRITLGRQSLAATSYVADVDREPPVDILDGVATHVAEKARVTEILEEHAS